MCQVFSQKKVLQSYEKNLVASPFLLYSLGMSTTSNTRLVQVQSFVEINEVEKELCFEFEFTPAERGSRGFYGEQMEPDTEGSMEFYSATDEDGMEIDALTRDIQAAMELAWQEVAED